jgi:lipoate-protein ligase A
VPAQHPRYTSRVTEIWDFLKSPSAGAAFNMALDEALLRTAAQRGRPLLRVYSWARPAVSFGYFQRFPTQLAESYELVRRPTGGGVVYHVEDTTYTVVVPPAHALHTMKTADAYRALHKAVAAAFALDRGCARVSDPAQNADRRSPGISGRPAVSPSARSGDRRTTEESDLRTAEVPRKSFTATTAAAKPELHDARLHSPQGQYECFQRPVHGDVVIDGRKLAGGAQRRAKSGMLHQGSIAAKLPVKQLRRGFEEVFGVNFEQYRLTDAERTLAEKLVGEKYATDAWNRYLR